MRYKLIGDGSLDNVATTILNNRGIQNIDKYLHLSKSDIEDYNDLDNIEQAVECFNNHFDKRDTIGILVDTDPDGVCSAAMMFNYIRHLDSEYPVYLMVHESNKAHGLQSNDFNIKDNTKLIICPDSSTNDIDECERLVKNGIDVIIADHHEKSDDRDSLAIILNNQTSERYYNKNACGTHVTWDFIKALDNYYWTDYSDSCLDLVAFANISDNMDITSISTRATINIGLDNVTNPMLKKIVEAQSFFLKDGLTPHSVSFSITPLLNAFLRLATYEERVLLMKAFCGIDDETFEYTKRGEVFPIEENIYEHMVRLIKSYKGKQDRMRDKALPILLKEAEKQMDNKVIMLSSDGIIDKSLNGLIAIRISDALHRPVLIGKQMSNGNFGGSGRNFDHSPIENLRDVVSRCPYCVLSQGHASAHGFEVTDVGKTIEWFNSELSDVDMTKVYLCDFIFQSDEINADFIKSIDNLAWLFGTGLKEPKVAIENIHLNKDDIDLCGKNMDTIKFKIGDIEFIQFKTSEGNPLYDYVNSWDDTDCTININAVVECSLNEYDGVVTPQCKLIEVEVV